MQISNAGRFDQDENLRNILIEGIINYCEQAKDVQVKRFPGSMTGLTYHYKSASDGLGFGYYKNDSEKNLKVILNNRRKNLQVCKPKF